MRPKILEDYFGKGNSWATSVGTITRNKGELYILQWFVIKSQKKVAVSLISQAFLFAFTKCLCRSS